MKRSFLWIVMGRLRWFLSAFLALASQPILAAEKSSLAIGIEEVINHPDYKNSQWGILITSKTDGTILYEHNPDKLVAPASTTKLYTVATALDAFGQDHRFETSVYYSGARSDSGELKGNLILVPAGDLTLGGRTDDSGGIAFTDVDHTYANGFVSHALTAPDPLAGLKALARQIAASGLKRLSGDVIVDDRLFEPAEGTGSGPSRLTPIVVNDNVIDFTIIPAKAGTPATVDWRPKSATLQVDAGVETAATNKDTRILISSPAPGRMVVRGHIPEGAGPLIRVQEVEDPASFARALFIEALQGAGISVTASPFASNPGTSSLPPWSSYKEEQRVALLKSPPFREEARLILKVSHNQHASILPMLVAVKNGKRTLADGLRLQHDFLGRIGVPVNEISFGGGAGGSRGDYTTPRATVKLLSYMATRPDFAAYENALPILGVDGTLATSVPATSAARGKARAKTGTLLWENTMNGGYLLTSKALAGYLTTAKNRELIVALYVNNVHLKKASDSALIGATLGHLCEVIYSN